MASPPLLRQAADVTPEWLTSALRDAGALADGAAVLSFATAPIGTGQMADTTRFALTLDEPGAGPASVVGKFASADDQSRGTGLALRAYEVEVRFYQEVAARIGGPGPVDLCGGGRTRDRMVHGGDGGHRRGGPGRSDRGVQS